MLMELLLVGVCLLLSLVSILLVGILWTLHTSFNDYARARCIIRTTAAEIALADADASADLPPHDPIMGYPE